MATNKAIEPRRMVELDGGLIQVWKNLPFFDWHSSQSRDTIFNEGVSCTDPNCPHPSHFGPSGMYDPHALFLKDELRAGTRILLFIEHAGEAQTALLTFFKFEEKAGAFCLEVLEESTSRFFFRNNSVASLKANDRPVIHERLKFRWVSVRYLAILETREPAFGIMGGPSYFCAELARLAGVPLREVEAALNRLDHEKLSPLRPQKLVTA